MPTNKHKKVTKYRRPFRINIGMIVFGIIFIYIVISVVTYFTKVHTKAYEVRYGEITSNNTYNGLILREESILNAESDGFVSYYAKEGDRIGSGKYVYALDEDGSLSSALKEKVNTGGTTLSDDKLNEIQKEISGFKTSYTDENFKAAYDFKFRLSGVVLEALNTDVLSDPSALGQSVVFHTYTAPQSGIVVYSTDGMEGITEETLTAENFQKKDYSKQALYTKEKVSAGTPIYKLITSENWVVYIPLDSKKVTELADQKTMKIRFLKDGTVATAGFSITNQGEEFYGRLELNSSMVNYAADRFVEIELMLSTKKGLKIPNSAIFEKSFFAIPKSYITKDTDGKTEGFLKETIKEDGTKDNAFVATAILGADDSNYYIGSEEIQEGDNLVMPNAADLFTVGQTATLPGVYNMNRGYAEFKEVEILFQNDSYSIVKSGTQYGLSAFDHIALDTKTVKEEELVY